jgi:hypothetical protein
MRAVAAAAEGSWVTGVENRKPGSGYGLGHRPEARHREAQAEVAGLVLEIWQELVGAALSPASEQRFRTHPDLAALCCYNADQLLVAGTELYSRTGQLLLAEWVRECAWEGGGTVTLDWAELAAGDPDAAIVARDLPAAAVASVRPERDRMIIAQRLGLDGDAGMTLQAIGENLGLTRERVRQLQDKALDQMCRPQIPPRASHYAGRVIAEVLGQAADVGTEPAVSLLTLAEAALPGIAAGLAVRVLARLAGHNHNTSRHLAAEVTTLLAIRRAELAREAREARAAERAAERLASMLGHAEWPGGRTPAPPRSLITPQREPRDSDAAGTWPSAKLAREVSYDSQAELSLIRALDRAPQIIWFCEQPVAIGYTFAGRHRTYYPDLLAATDDGCCVLIEVKAVLDMPLAINQAKATAARAFCTRRGWGYLLTDDVGRTLHDLLNLPVPGQAAQGFADALREAGTMTWRDIKAHRERHGLTAVQVGALAIQRGWHIRLDPYRMSERP